MYYKRINGLYIYYMGLVTRSTRQSSLVSSLFLFPINNNILSYNHAKFKYFYIKNEIFLYKYYPCFVAVICNKGWRGILKTPSPGGGSAKPHAKTKRDYL